MKKYLSPGNLIVTAGGILAFIGMTAYFTDSVNLSVPTFFYGVPIFLIGRHINFELILTFFSNDSLFSF